MATRYTLGMFVLALFMMAAGTLAHAVPRQADCIAPAQSGGGFDLTCRLLAEALAAEGVTTDRSILPGGVGAVAFNTILNQRADDAATLVAFSEGSIYNLALGRYGAHDLDDVQWVAMLALDYGVVLVRDDAPWRGLPDLLADAREAPERLAFGGGGDMGGQDWTRLATTAQMAGIDPSRMRYVAFEGGGSCVEALLARFVQVCLNDAGDSRTAMDQGAPLRILAVHAPQRLTGAMADVPTAREQGIDLDWPVVRGVYTGPRVPAADVADWSDTLQRIMHTDAYAALLARHHLQPMPLTGTDLRRRLDDLESDARRRAAQLGVP